MSESNVVFLCSINNIYTTYLSRSVRNMCPENGRVFAYKTIRNTSTCRSTIFYLVLTYFALSRVNWNSSHSSSCKAHKQLYKDWWNPWIVSEPILWTQDWSFNTPLHTHLFLIWLRNSITVRSQKCWWVVKKTLNVKFLAQEHNAITSTSAWTKTFSISSSLTLGPLYISQYTNNLRSSTESMELWIKKALYESLQTPVLAKYFNKMKETPCSVFFTTRRYPTIGLLKLPCNYIENEKYLELVSKSQTQFCQADSYCNSATCRESQM